MEYEYERQWVGEAATKWCRKLSVMMMQQTYIFNASKEELTITVISEIWPCYNQCPKKIIVET